MKGKKIEGPKEREKRNYWRGRKLKIEGREKKNERWTIKERKGWKNRCKKGRKVSNKMFGLPEVVFRVGLVSCAQV